MNKIIVTGGSGLVGSEMFFGKRISSKDLDLTDRNKTIEYFCDTKPEWVIHCAGFVGGVKANMDYKYDFFNKNLLMNLHILEACHKANVKNLIAFMSTCIFPEKHASTIPLTEDLIHDGEPHFSNNAYAHAKRMIDIGINAIKSQHGDKNWFSLIPTNIYGKNDNFHLENSHLIAALIRKAYESKINKKDFVVWGSGNPIREFIYAPDVAKIIYRMINENFISKYDKIIISSNKSYTIKEVANEIAKIFNIDKILYDNTKPDGQYKKETNTQRFKELFPDFIFTSLNDGLNETIKHYINKIQT